MKNLLTLCLMTFFVATVSAQTFIMENFSAGSMPPEGWTINGIPAQWSVAPSDAAGGVAPEAKFTYVNGTYVTRLISFELDLTGLTEVTLSFRHFYDDYSGTGPKAGVATRSHNGDWNVVWEINPSSSVGPEKIDLTINNADVGQDEFQICFYLDGNMYNIDYWYLDDILLVNPLNLDAVMLGITTPTYVTGQVPVQGGLMNAGLTPIQTLSIDYQLDNGPVQTTELSGLSIPTFGTYDFTLEPLVTAPIGNHEVMVKITQVNGEPDDDTTNNSLSKPLIWVSNVIPKKPCFEEFTSSTCGPCAGFNTSFVPWCNTNAENITLIKYQMSWPAPGDPYYTAEGGVRQAFYGVGFVPDLYCNGSNVATDMSAVQSAFNQANLQPGLIDIAASHTLAGTVMSVDVALLPFADFTDAVLHVIVFEYITTGNVGNNGETEFHHVMMKMIPDANGTGIDLEDRVPFTWSGEADLASTHVEEWDDLGVLVLIQDPSAKMIYQSVYSVENGVFNDEARLSDIQVNGVSIPGFDPDIFSYDVEVPGGVIIPDITGTPMDQNATVITINAETIPGTTTMEVFAEDLVTHHLYEVNLIFATGTPETGEPAIRIYPNPVTDVLHITGAGHATVSLHSPNGTIVASVPDFTGNLFRIPDVPNGVYLLQIEKSSGTTLRQKVVVIR